MEMKIDREWSTFLKIFEKFFLHRPSGARELPLNVFNGTLEDLKKLTIK